MKFVHQISAGLVSLAFAVSAQAVITSQYAGSGIWKTLSGNSGTYTIQTKVEADGDTVKVFNVLTYDGKTHNSDLTLKKINDTFYDVVNEKGESIGLGYCFPSENEKTCHTEVTKEDSFMEVTLHQTKDMLHSVGSMLTFSTGEKIIWKDSLKPKT